MCLVGSSPSWPGQWKLHSRGWKVTSGRNLYFCSLVWYQFLVVVIIMTLLSLLWGICLMFSYKQLNSYKIEFEYDHDLRLKCLTMMIMWWVPFKTNIYSNLLRGLMVTTHGLSAHFENNIKHFPWSSLLDLSNRRTKFFLKGEKMVIIRPWVCNSIVLEVFEISHMWIRTSLFCFVCFIFCFVLFCFHYLCSNKASLFGFVCLFDSLFFLLLFKFEVSEIWILTILVENTKMYQLIATRLLIIYICYVYVHFIIDTT